MDDLQGSSTCGLIKYIIPYKPTEITHCHCTICRNLHEKPFSCFAKYELNDLIFKVEQPANIGFYASSDRANRAFCTQCQTYLFMKYKNSDNIWIYANTMSFNIDSIDNYDIYIDTRDDMYIKK